MNAGQEQAGSITGGQAGKQHWKVCHDMEDNLALSQPKSQAYILCRLVNKLPVQLIGGHGCLGERQAGYHDPAGTANWWVWRRQSDYCDSKLKLHGLMVSIPAYVVLLYGDN